MLRRIVADLTSLRDPRTLRYGVVSGYALTFAFSGLVALGVALGVLPWHPLFATLLGMKLVSNTLAWLGLRFDRFALELGGVNVCMDAVVMTGAIEFPGYGTVRRRTMSKEDLVELWTDIRERTHLPVKEGVRIEVIEPEGAAWRVRGDSFSDRAANVVLALGRRGAPRELGVPGEELAKVAYRVIEPEVFADTRVLVVGGGNAAADCAIALAELGGCRAVGLSYRRDELARVRASVKDRIELLIRQAKIMPLFGTEVVAIAPHHVMLKSARGMQQLENDHVVVQIGGTAPSQLLHSLGIELVEKRGEA